MNKTPYETGFEIGVERGSRQFVLEILQRKFGNLSNCLRNHVESLDRGELVQLLERVGPHKTLEDAGLAPYRD